MKGRILTVEEVNNLKVGQVVYVEPLGDYRGDYSETGKGIVQSEPCGICVRVGNCESWMLHSDTTKYTEYDVNNWLNIYEYIETPRIYKTSEMIAMLEENQELRFIANNGEDGEGICCIVDNEIVIKGEEPVLYLDDTWQLIEEPKEVTFLEAVKAFSEGKTIYSLDEIGIKVEYSPKNIYELVDKEDGFPIVAADILDNKWFIS